ncbi:hypothetical protein ACYZX9_14590 [Sphingomonas citri]
MMLLMLLAAASPDPLGEVSRNDASSRVTDTVDVYQQPGTPPTYRFTYVRAFSNGATQQVVTTTSLACPQAMTALAEARVVLPERFAPYGTPGQSVHIVPRGVSYEMNFPTPMANGWMRLIAAQQSPLAKPVEDLLDAVHRCRPA